MTAQTSYLLAAATVGFVSALFFCLGNIANSTQQIMLQSSPFWDFNPHIAQALSHQRAQNTVGAVLLLAAFVLQVIAALVSPTTPARCLPGWLQSWPCLVAAVFAPTLAVSLLGYRLLASWILRRVTRLREAERLKNAPQPDSSTTASS